MKRIKRYLAVFLALWIGMSGIPALEVWGTPAGNLEEKDEEVDAGKATPGNADRRDDDEEEVVEETDDTEDEEANSSGNEKDDNVREEEEDLEKEQDQEKEEKPADTKEQSGLRTATTSNASQEAEDEVRFNTGNGTFSVVGEEDFEQGFGDDVFEEDGSYTIQIPEENPFFPYEVQFIWDGHTESEWFMTPDDSVRVGGHRFYVSAYFDGTVVTQMSLNVGGDTVVVYPEEKEFSESAGIMPLSLMPLEERALTVDLTGYTPVELTMVSVDGIFAGEEDVLDTDKVVWTYGSSGDSYTVSSMEDRINMSQGSSYSDSTRWQMIVGDADQLTMDNVRYLVEAMVTPSGDWLVPTVYQAGENGEWTRKTISESSGFDVSEEGNELYIEVEEPDLENGETYLGLQVNPDVFPDVSGDSLRVYEGLHDTIDDVLAAEDVTELLFPEDMSVAGSGYLNARSQDFTFVSFSSAGEITGILPVEVYLEAQNRRVRIDGLYSDANPYDILRSLHTRYNKEWEVTATATLDAGYPAEGTYRLVLSYMHGSSEANSNVTAAYEGSYGSREAAKAAGAVDIKDRLFDAEQGYAADYSQGRLFTIFVEEEGQEICYSYKVTTVEGNPVLSNSTLVYFYGVVDSQGNEIASYVVDEEEDSYGEYNYLTILVGQEADLSELAPRFGTADGINLYAEGGSAPEVSGESYHDFSNGAVQYTASSESGTDFKNYWLRIIQAETGAASLYINSLEDDEADTRSEDGVIYSTREVMIDGLHNDQHDILLINTGTEPIPNLSVELESEQVYLDEYWTLSGKNDLSGFTTVDDTGTNYGELANLAKLRLLPLLEDGSEVSGTLTIKSGDTVLMVLNLTGTVGDPSIITTDIPGAVKYVPYGTMIQNSNKYDWNQITYGLRRGELPDGMILRPNGEVYGVPTESGEFSFTVEMENSYSGFSDSIQSFVLTVTENTDANVEAATDEGYMLTQRVQDFALAEAMDQTMVSEGVYDEFVDIFLDGTKLQEGVDYDSESGSTRITIRSQTLRAANQTGTHTIGIEFRTRDTNTLKRAAQNYEITSVGGSSSRGSSGSGSSSEITTITRDSKKGYVDVQRGILTGDGAGYSRWAEDENGWRLIYADGTAAAGSMVEQETGNTVEQILWEKVNGSWYAFGADGYLKSGWVYDYQLEKWYLLAVENGMQTGWYNDSQDGCTYYLDQSSGELVHGWRQIDQSWYYFNEVVQGRTWELDEETGNWYYNVRSTSRPYGSLYRDGITPDGYEIGSSGAWNATEN